MALMEFYGSSSTIILLLPVVFLLLGLKAYRRRAKKPYLPPGPPGFPFIGNMHQIGAAPHRSLWKLAQKYGSVMLIRLGSVPTVVISSAEAAREVLRFHDVDCCSRPIITGPKRLSYNLSDVGFGPYTEYWKEMRKIFVNELFSFKRLHSLRSVREEEVARMIHSIAEASPGPVNLTEELFALSQRIVCNFAFGRSDFGDSLGKAITDALGLLRSFCAQDLFPHLGWIIDQLSGFHKNLETTFHELDAFYQSVIDDHLDPKRPKPEHEDLADTLLRLENERVAGILITKDHIKAIFMDILIAGVETGATSMVWAMAELIKNPRVMTKLQTEVRNCIGTKGKVEESDLNQLVYLKMVIKENLRMHPPVTFLIPRETLRPFKINGYDIHPETRIEVNNWAIARDPQSWEHPEEFWPERFMDSSIEFKGQHFELLPFGSGRRICPGVSMATAEIELALANLVYSFNWKLPGGVKNEDIDMEETTGVAVQKKAPLYLVPISYN